MKPIIKKPKSTFDELLAKYKKGDAHTENRPNRNVRKVKPELPISPRQADVSIAGQHGDSKQPESSSNAKPHSQDRRERKLHAATPFPSFRYSTPEPCGPSPMIFHPYAPCFCWYAPPMQYESFYPRSAKHEPNVFDRSTHPRDDRFYPKIWLNAAKTQE
jgi:hypothetical protein